MKNKNITGFILAIFLFVCAILMISCSYYQKSTPTFLKLAYRKEIIVDDSYLELKNSLFQKYEKRFNELLESTKKEYTESFTEILGEEYKTLNESLENNISTQRTMRANFLNGEEYLNAKRKMYDLKSKMDAETDGDKKDELFAEFQSSLADISTLNIKLNNSLKAYKEKESSIRESLKNLYDGKKEQLLNAKKQIENKTRTELLSLLSEFNFELKELNEVYGIVNGKKEYPFNLEKVNGYSVASKFDSDYFYGNSLETSSDNSTEIEIYDENGNLKSIKTETEDNYKN